MKCDAGIHGKSLEPFPDQFRVEGAHLVVPKFGPEYQKRPARNIDRHACQRFVHRQVGIRIACDTLHVPESLLDGLAERNTDIFRGVVLVDMQVTLGFDGQVDARMTGQKVQHMVKKADPGVDRGYTGTVEIDIDPDIGFLGGAGYGGLAHVSCLSQSSALYQGPGGFATATTVKPSGNCVPVLHDLHVGPTTRSQIMQQSSAQLPVWHGTTILTVRKNGTVAIGGDGQVSIGQTIIKANAKKVRRLGKGDVIGGFAGATADAFTLFERLESKLEQYPGQLTRAAVELAKDWRTDRYLRRLEAMMIVADAQVSLVLTGTGDVLEPESGVVGIGSGGNYALAAARALVDGPLDAEAIVRRSLDIAADICVYTNRNVTIEKL